jgi:hypothetical protein
MRRHEANGPSLFEGIPKSSRFWDITKIGASFFAISKFLNLEAKMRKITLALLIVVVGLFMAGCGSQSSTTSTNNPPGNITPVGMTITDTPPQGVTVLFFQLSITGATLTSSTGTQVSLLSSTNPIPINVSQLQSELFFLGAANVAGGTYNNLSVTFANPQLTILNASDTNISSTCPVGQVCQITPSLTTGSSWTVSFSSTSTPPFSVTLTPNSPVAFKLDIHLDTVIQNDLTLDLSIANGVTVSVISPPSPRLGKLRGTIQTVNTSSNDFTLQTWEGRTFTIDVNSSTTYENFPINTTTCTTEGFGCLAAGQYVKVAVTLQSDGSLLATDVDYLAPSAQLSVEGTIIGLSTSNGNTIMDLILQWEPSSSMSNMLPLGHFAQVTVPSTGVNYSIDWNGFTFTAPSGVTFSPSFASASDLQVGQQVTVVVQGTVNTSGAAASTAFGLPGLTFTASDITLEASQITGTVASQPNTTLLSFTLATFPVFFVPPSSTPGSPPPWAPVIITVQTTSATTLTNFSSLSSLEVNNVVSVDGWVFSTPTGATPITVVADQVILRTGVPLF